MHFRPLVVFSASVLVLAACGGDNGGATPAPDPAAASNAGDEADNGGPTDATPTPDTPAASSAGDGADPDDGESGAAPAIGSSGTMTVDGEVLDVIAVRRCVPFDASEFGGAEGDPNEIDLIIFDSSSGGLNLNALTTDGYSLERDEYDMSIHELRLNQGGDEYKNRAGTMPDGTWILGFVPQFGDPGDGTPIDDAPFIVDGNNISGAMSLVQTWPEGADGTVDVTFNVVFPSEQEDCSL